MQTMENEKMASAMERSKQRIFISEISSASGALAVWVQDKLFVDNWSIDDVKIAIKSAMKVCERE